MKKLIGMFLMLSIISFAFSSKLLYDTTSDNFKTPISLTALDQSVAQVLDALAERAGVNLVQSSETVDKKVTLTLNDIPIKDALDLVIRATDLSYQIIDNSIIVASDEKINREIGLNTSVFDLQYADAKTVKKMLADISKKIQIDDLGNRIIYQASPKVAKEIEKVLIRIDRPLQQVLFKARIKEVGNESGERYGVEWEKVSNYSTTLREGAFQDYGDWTYNSADNTYEFDYDPLNYPERNLSGNYTDAEAYNLFSRSPSFANETSAGLTNPWHRVIGQEYVLSLDFKNRNNDATILAEPEIATLNNKEAYVHIGDIVPYTVTSIESGTTKQSVQKEEVGIKLRVRPIINEENDITVQLSCEVSSIFGWVGPNSEIPWVKIRKADTTVRVRDGQTIRIAGMLLEDDTYTVNKVPLLGDIPFLGYFFQHQVKTKKITNLIIEVTPYIMIDGEIVLDEEEEFE
ncbi:MAG: secretin and TonB N-terminal domain-containing protein [Candidatus Delongbacteria bacterium]|jgi:type IV pilus assembly protein PilQ|nr:secretin and TonB N-terminal domain-containing protein [Candidatus Delongbacteria bacterium]